MGARQSKRSVDITTAAGVAVAPESGGEVVAGKLGKLEDGIAEVPKQNGDAVLKDKERQLDSETPENEKDSSTEKGLLVPPAAADSATTPAAVENGLGDASPDEDPVCAVPAKEEAPEETKPPVEEPQSPTSGAEESQEVVASPEEKQPEKKKEKKKKWSFRSISFSKKDKQKPSKKDKQQEENGEIEKVPEEAGDDAVAAAPGGDVPVSVKEDKPAENKTAPVVAEETTKSEEAPVCKKPAPEADKSCEKPVVAPAPAEQEKEKPSSTPAAEPVVDVKPETVCEKPVAVEAVPQIAEEKKDVAPIVEAEPAKIEETKTDEPAALSPVAEEPQKKQEEETAPLPPAAVEEQKEVCDNTSPPPLPETLPPSQVSVFAETMMAPIENALTAAAKPEPMLIPAQLQETPSSLPAQPVSDPTPLSPQTPSETTVVPENIEELPAPVPSEQSVESVPTGSVEVHDSKDESLPVAPAVSSLAELAAPASVTEVSAPVSAASIPSTQSDAALEILPAPEECPKLMEQAEELPSPPPSPPSTQEVTKTEVVETPLAMEGQLPPPPAVEEQLPSPPASPISGQDVSSVSESAAALNTNTEEQLPSPPPSPVTSMQDTSTTDSPLPPPVLDDLSQTAEDQGKSGSFDDSASLPPPPCSAVDSMTSMEYNAALMCPPPLPIGENFESNTDVPAMSPTKELPEIVQQQQDAPSENIAEVSATESTHSEDKIAVSPTNKIDEKVPGMIMLDDTPPMDVPMPDTTVVVADN